MSEWHLGSIKSSHWLVFSPFEDPLKMLIFVWVCDKQRNANCHDFVGSCYGLTYKCKDYISRHISANYLPHNYPHKTSDNPNPFYKVFRWVFQFTVALFNSTVDDWFPESYNDVWTDIVSDSVAVVWSPVHLHFELPHIQYNYYFISKNHEFLEQCGICIVSKIWSWNWGLKCCGSSTWASKHGEIIMHKH